MCFCCVRLFTCSCCSNSNKVNDKPFPKREPDNVWVADLSLPSKPNDGPPINLSKAMSRGAELSEQNGEADTQYDVITSDAVAVAGSDVNIANPLDAGSWRGPFESAESDSEKATASDASMDSLRSVQGYNKDCLTDRQIALTTPGEDGAQIIKLNDERLARGVLAALDDETLGQDKCSGIRLEKGRSVQGAGFDSIAAGTPPPQRDELFEPNGHYSCS